MIDLHYLELLSGDYPTIQAASSEIINLNAILNLPKGTEYFFSDLHGEHEAFLHLLHSASGVIRSKIDEQFEKSVSEADRTALAALIYDPERELSELKRTEENLDDWARITIYRLVEVCKAVSSKYTRSKVRKKLPEGFSYVIDELLHAGAEENKGHYYNELIGSIVTTGMAEEFIGQMCILIRQLTIDMLHIIGDIFDRGPHADAIVDALMEFHDVDVQWGNHDISWMGAAVGNPACIANVIRLGISYNNFDLLEDGYGINLRSLSLFAAQTYRDDPCTLFIPHILDENKYDPVDSALAAKMHKAIAVIQFKMEGQLIERHPEYEMDSRALLKRIDYEKGEVKIDGVSYPLKDTLFPTIDPKNPLALTKGEEELMKTIAASFRHSERLQKHMRFLFTQGSMVKRINSNLLYHGCIPMKPDGSFDTETPFQEPLGGKEYLERIDDVVRHAYYSREADAKTKDARDFMWYLWCGPKSPLFGKSKLAAFERYFIEDKATHKEEMNPYYRLIEHREACVKVLMEFGLDPAHSHIINGHVPVRIKQGESPIKGGGLLYMIDGGISKAYQSQTGIGGYTFIYNSRSLALAEHKPYCRCKGKETAPQVRIVEAVKNRVTVADTDIGQKLSQKAAELNALLDAYRQGDIKEKRNKNISK